MPSVFAPWLRRLFPMQAQWFWKKTLPEAMTGASAAKKGSEVLKEYKETLDKNLPKR